MRTRSGLMATVGAVAALFVLVISATGQKKSDRRSTAVNLVDRWKAGEHGSIDVTRYEEEKTRNGIQSTLTAAALAQPGIEPI